MKINKKYCLLIITVSLILILAIGMATAASISTNNDTTNKKDNTKVSTVKTVKDTKTSNANPAKITTNTNITKAKQTTKATKTDTNIIYVNSTADSNNNGQTKENATTLTNAINKATTNSIITLTNTNNNDTYTGTTDIYGKTITIQAEDGKTVTFNGQNSNKLFNIYSSSLTLKNLVIINAVSYYGAIKANNSVITVDNCTIINNKGNQTGAVFSLNTTLTVKNSVLENNTSLGDGGTVLQLDENQLNIINSTFKNNQAKYDGGCVYSIGAPVSVTNSTFKNNTAKNGGALYLGVNKYNQNDHPDDADDDYIDYPVFKGELKVNNNIFENNTASKHGGSIWAINNNVFTDLQTNTLYLTKTMHNNINYNWWSKNSPNFDIVTNGIIPDNWRLLKLSDASNANTIQLQVSINTLSDNNIVTIPLPARTVTFKADSGSFDYITSTITGTVDNTYTGTSSNINITVDNQIVNLGEKIEPYLSINNVSAIKGENVTFLINANRAIKSVNITINGQEIKINNIINGTKEKSYNTTSLSPGNYTVTLSFNGNGNYSSKNVTGYLYVKDTTPNIVIIPITTEDLTPSKIDLPSSYDLRDYGYVTSVKDQGNSGVCWTFSSLASLESVLKKLLGTEYDFSENNIKNILKKYSTIGDFGYYGSISGANDLEPIGYYVGWYGPINETDDPYYDTSSIFSAMMNEVLHIQDVYIIPERTSAMDNNAIKQAIYIYGAVSTGINSGSLNHYSGSSNITHAVAIVGWNDTYTVSGAPGPGAFIIKNSWGNASGDGGYYYVSYYEPSIGSLCLHDDPGNYQFNYVVLYNNTDNYDNIYQYDTVVDTLDASNYGADNYGISNIYTIERDEYIGAVGTYVMQASEYDIRITINGKEVYNQVGTITLPGYRTIRLNEYIPVMKGDVLDTTIYITAINGYAKFLLQYADSYNSQIKSGQSWLYSDDEWTDLYDGGFVAPVKVYTKNVAVVNFSYSAESNIITVNTNISNYQNEGNLTFYVNGEPVRDSQGNIIVTQVNGNGEYSTYLDQYSIGIEKFNLTVVFQSDNYQILQNLTIENQIESLDSYIVINNIAENYVESTFTITGYVKHNDTYKVSNQNVIVSINGNNYTTKTDNDGKFSYNYYATVVGTNNVTVSFNGNSVFNTSTNKTSFTAIIRYSNISIDTISGAKTSDNVKISGKFYVNNVAKANAKITLKIGSNTYNLTTDSNGAFSTYYTIPSATTYTVTATFVTNATVSGSNATYTFTAGKATPTLSLNSIANNYVGDTAVIKGKLSVNSYNLAGYTVVVDINGNSSSVKTDSNGNYIYNYVVTSAGTYNVTVSFAGDTNYNECSNKLSFTSTKKDTRITLNSISNVYVMDTALIKGRVLEGNNPLSGVSVSIVVNSNSYTAKTDSSGYFTMNYMPTVVGTYNVTVSYAGDANYNECSNKLSFTSTKKDTRITLNSISNTYVKNTALIKGRVLGGNNPLSSVSVSVMVNSKNYTTKTDSNGYFTLNYTPTSAVTNNVSVTYSGNGSLKASSNKTTFKSVKKTPTLTVNAIKTAYVGDKVVIQGTLKYNNTAIKSLLVYITVGGKTYSVKTDSKGNYKLTYNTTAAKKLSVSIKYKGSAEYNSVKKTTSFSVVKKAVVLTVNSLKAKYTAKTTIKVSGLLKDASNKVVKSAKIAITINNKNYTVKTNSKGKFTLRYKLPKKGTYKIKVKFNGDTKLKASKLVTKTVKAV